MIWTKIKRLTTWDAQSKAELDVKDIEHLLKSGKLNALSLIGIQSGFINDDIRARVYERIFASQFSHNTLIKSKSLQLDEEGERAQAHIISLDVHRSYNTPHLVSNKSSIDKEHHRSALKRVLTRFFIECPQYSYYQGFNAVASVLVMLYGEEHGLILIKGLSRCVLADYLATDRFNDALQHAMDKIADIVYQECGIKLSAW